MMRTWWGIACLAALVVPAPLSYAQSGSKSQSPQSGAALATAQELNRGRSSIKGELSRFTSQAARSRVFEQSLPRNSGIAVQNLFQTRGDIHRLNSKPFAATRVGGSVSPYLEYDNPFGNAGTSYYTQVRPRQEQQRREEFAQRQQAAQERRLSTYEVKGPYDPTGDGNKAPTGHAAVYQFFGGFQNTGDFYQKSKYRPRY